MNIQLSEGFETFETEKKMPSAELIVRSTVALTLGIVPFLINQVAIAAFRVTASIGKYGKTFKFIAAIPGITFATIMLAAAKVFAWTQFIPWGKYVTHPTGDGANTRLAWYGAKKGIHKDLIEIIKAFYGKESKWSLQELTQIKI